MKTDYATAVERFVAEYMPSTSPYRPDGGIIHIDGSLLHHAGMLPNEAIYGPADRTVVDAHFEAIREAVEAHRGAKQ